jgi:hypothetical protein
MANTVIRLYDNFDNAENARNALLSSGFSAEEVQLSANEDEAGAVQGNFYVGNGNDDDESYDGNYAKPKYRSAYMLTVDARDEDRSKSAADILDQFGPTDVDQLTARARASR